MNWSKDFLFDSVLRSLLGKTPLLQLYTHPIRSTIYDAPAVIVARTVDDLCRSAHEGVAEDVHQSTSAPSLCTVLHHTQHSVPLYLQCTVEWYR